MAMINSYRMANKAPTVDEDLRHLVTETGGSWLWESGSSIDWPSERTPEGPNLRVTIPNSLAPEGPLYASKARVKSGR